MSLIRLGCLIAASILLMNYARCLRKGLEYEVLTGDSNQPWHNTIPWHELPKDFPRNSSDIMQSKNVCLSTILFHASKTHDVTPANAANSLHTTAEDYARFCIHWMQDKEDPLVQNAFTSKVSLTKDRWAVKWKYKARCLGTSCMGLRLGSGKK
jgi:hypothetical protein